MHNIVRKVFAKLGILYCKQNDIMILWYYTKLPCWTTIKWLLVLISKKTGDYRHFKILWTFVWWIFSEHINSSFLNFLKIPTFLDFLDFWSDALQRGVLRCETPMCLFGHLYSLYLIAKYIYLIFNNFPHPF